MRPLAAGLAILVGVLSGSKLSAAEPPSPPPSFARLGPYPVGVRTIVLVDEARKDEGAGGTRTLVTDVWYPAADDVRGRATKRFVDFFGSHPEAAEAFVSYFGGRLDEVNRRFKCEGVKDAPLRPGKYPLLVFSHGNGGLRQQNAFQLDHLASHGYVIATADHTGNAGVAVLPDRVVPYDRAGKGQAAPERTKDVRFLLDRLLALDREEGSWLHGALERDAIGVLGHSFGGYTSCQVAAEDPRVKAILPMTLAFGGSSKVPTMVMLAGLDRTVREAGNFASRAYWVSCPAPKYLVLLRRAGHFSFSDMDLINPTFGDGVGSETRGGVTTRFLESDRAKTIIRSYGLAFFQWHLRRSREAEEFLRQNMDPEEVEYLCDLGEPHPPGGTGSVPSTGPPGGTGSVPSSGSPGGTGAVPSSGPPGGTGSVPSSGPPGPVSLTRR
jgi:predicted dienelactone hydrolase